MKLAIAAAEKLLTSYPDYGKSTDTYIAAICEAIAELPDDIVAAVLDLRTGIRARCAFLPTIADIMKFAEEYTARRDQFKPLPRAGIYTLLNAPAERDPTPEERERALAHWEEVRTEMQPPDNRLKMPPNLSDDEALCWLAKNLKTPPAPPSQELIDLVKQQVERNPTEERWI